MNRIITWTIALAGKGRGGGLKGMREGALPEWAETPSGSVRSRIAPGPSADGTRPMSGKGHYQI